MKFNYLIKTIPLLSTLLLLSFISVTNQKEYTKLRILIWDTPRLSIGTYLTISTATGFILSYLITTNFANIYQANKKKSLKYKNEYKNELRDKPTDTAANASYENTLIERDIKDPSPTINANFRVIGRRDISSTNFINNNSQYDDSIEFEEQYDEFADKNQVINQLNNKSNDWNDESYSNW